jgi:hypothetical protein
LSIIGPVPFSSRFLPLSRFLPSVPFSSFRVIGCELLAQDMVVVHRAGAVGAAGAIGDVLAGLAVGLVSRWKSHRLFPLYTF